MSSATSSRRRAGLTGASGFFDVSGLIIPKPGHLRKVSAPPAFAATRRRPASLLGDRFPAGLQILGPQLPTTSVNAQRDIRREPVRDLKAMRRAESRIGCGVSGLVGFSPTSADASECLAPFPLPSPLATQASQGRTHPARFDRTAAETHVPHATDSTRTFCISSGIGFGAAARRRGAQRTSPHERSETLPAAAAGTPDEQRAGRAAAARETRAEQGTGMRPRRGPTWGRVWGASLSAASRLPASLYAGHVRPPQAARPADDYRPVGSRAGGGGRPEFRREDERAKVGDQLELLGGVSNFNSGILSKSKPDLWQRVTRPTGRMATISRALRSPGALQESKLLPPRSPRFPLLQLFPSSELLYTLHRVRSLCPLISTRSLCLSMSPRSLCPSIEQCVGPTKDRRVNHL
ncbi:MAG: hypothetical protein BJ554DRAFT_8300, partial [Olpidium bornovanus]